MPKLQKKLKKASELAMHFERETDIIKWLNKTVETNFNLEAGNIIEKYEELQKTH